MALFLEGAAVLAFPEGPWRATLRFAGKHRTPILLVAAYLVMRVILRGFRVLRPEIRAKDSPRRG